MDKYFYNSEVRKTFLIIKTQTSIKKILVRQNKKVIYSKIT